MRASIYTASAVRFYVECRYQLQNSGLDGLFTNKNEKGRPSGRPIRLIKLLPGDSVGADVGAFLPAGAWIVNYFDAFGTLRLEERRHACDDASV